MGDTNLTSEASLQAHAEQPQRTRMVNVGEGERYVSILVGLGLILAGIVGRGLRGLILGGLGAAIVQRGVTGHSPLFQSMGVSSAKATRPGVPDNVGVKVERGITINRPREEIFSFLRDVRNLPRFMDHLERVEVIDHKRSHWVAKGLRGRKLQWDAEIINEHPNEMIAWETLPGAAAPSAGSVRLEPAPGGRGTEVRISLEVNPPGGLLGSVGAKLFGATPDEEVEEDLVHLKQVLEAGEVPTTEGQPTGRA